MSASVAYVRANRSTAVQARWWEGARFILLASAGLWAAVWQIVTAIF